VSFWSCCAMSDTLFVFSFWILSWVVLKRRIKTGEIKIWAWMSSAWLCSWPERYCKCDYSSDRKLVKIFQIRATATNDWHHDLFLKNWHISDVNEIVHVEHKWSACSKTSVVGHMNLFTGHSLADMRLWAVGWGGGVENEYFKCKKIVFALNKF
jgi:hypothetical protein